MSTIFDTASGNITKGTNVMGDIAAGGLPAQSMNAYINPYQSQVISDTLGRLRDQHSLNLGAVGDQAIQGGAFGGARHGLVEAAITDDYMRNVGETAGRLNQAGFDTALNAGFNDARMQQQAGQSLFDMGLGQYNLGRNLMADQSQAGQQQRQLNQNLLNQAGSWLDQYVGSPANSAGQVGSIIGGSPLKGNMTQGTKPGLFDYVGLGLQAGFGGGK